MPSTSTSTFPSAPQAHAQPQPPSSSLSSIPPKSRFTHRHLSLLLSPSTATSPLRAIAHIDLDAFYAQCETVRLGLSPDAPLAVQQWQSLIAVNYAARPFGITRHITAAEARTRCPDIVLQHVATWKEGDGRWRYRDGSGDGGEEEEGQVEKGKEDGEGEQAEGKMSAKEKKKAEERVKNRMETEKVALDYYRGESRKIFKVIKEVLAVEGEKPGAPGVVKVEKAGIDEVFLDLSARVHKVMLERYQELRGPPPYDDPSENLPRPSTTALNWETDHLIDLDENQTEDDDPDWDDVAMAIASEIVRDVRKAIYERLKYTTAAGVAKNKMLAKLGSGFKKPNQQTVIRNRAIQKFLSGFKFTKIRNMGGKLGDEVVKQFGTDLITDLLAYPLEELEKRLGKDGTGTWLWGLIRGEDLSEVNPRTQIKSMLSAKSFTQKIDDIQTASRWLHIFAADIFSRCVDEGVLEHRRRPRTITLHHRTGNSTRSKQSTIPQGLRFSEEMLYDLATKLLVELVASGRVWPCSNLSLSIGSFEETVRSMGIGNFLVHGDEAKALLESERQRPDPRTDFDESQPPEKRRKVDSSGIQRFFGRRDSTKDSSESDFISEPALENGLNMDGEVERTTRPDGANAAAGENDGVLSDAELPADVLPPSAQQTRSSSPLPGPSKHLGQLHQQTLETFFCSRCNAHIPLDGKGEHEDWHVAKDLSDEWNAEERQNAQATSAAVAQPRVSTPAQKTPARGRGRPPGGGGKRSEKGQMKLAFGRS